MASFSVWKNSDQQCAGVVLCCVPGNAIEKIIEDQKEFEKENQFMQEEVMEPASTSPGLLSDTSWRLPASSHILMRASQVSQELDRGNQSYLRLSLGTFFQQRSEALGCLGDDREDDAVKRVWDLFSVLLTPLCRPLLYSFTIHLVS
jgi:hypothetical protein